MPQEEASMDYVRLLNSALRSSVRHIATGLSSVWNLLCPTQGTFTWFLKDSGSMGSSAAREMLLRRMKRRMMLVNVVALMMR